MKDQKNMYPRKTRHEKTRRIIYEFSYKMCVLNEKRCKRLNKFDTKSKNCLNDFIKDIMFLICYILCYSLDLYP